MVLPLDFTTVGFVFADFVGFVFADFVGFVFADFVGFVFADFVLVRTVTGSTFSSCENLVK
jgi:hypothetical protein